MFDLKTFIKPHSSSVGEMLRKQTGVEGEIVAGEDAKKERQGPAWNISIQIGCRLFIDCTGHW